MSSDRFAANPQGTKILIVCVVFLGLAFIAVTLRFLSRWAKKQPLVLNDYAIFFAFLLSIGNVIVVEESVKAGFGRHIMEVALNPLDIIQIVKLQITLTCIWMATLTLVKISMLDLYVKIFRTTRFVNVVYAYMALQVAWGIAGILITTLICRPIEKNWNPMLPGHCGSNKKAYYASHIIIFILDFGVAVLPIPMLWKLRMPLSKKIGVSCLFAVGIVIGTFDLIRIAWRSKIDDPDFTYAYAILYMFTLLEPELGITLTCLPLIQPAIRVAIDSPVFSWTKSLGSRLISTNRTGTDKSSSNISKPTSQHQVGWDRLNDDSSSLAKLHRDQYSLEDIETGKHDSQIKVTQTWNVRSG